MPQPGLMTRLIFATVVPELAATAAAVVVAARMWKLVLLVDRLLAPLSFGYSC